MQVIHNPGTPPDKDLASPGIVDVIITCEEPFDRYMDTEVQERLVEYPLHRARAGHQVSGVPRERIREMTRDMRRRAAYVFLTSLTEDFYESFGECWKSFVDAVEIDHLDIDTTSTS